MKGYNEQKFRLINAALIRFPNLSDRAVAKLTGTSPATVGKVRAINGLPTDNRTEMSGRRARGREPIVQYCEEELPNGIAAVYRAYSDSELLYVGSSATFIQRLATHGRRPWWPEVTRIAITHFTSRPDAENAVRTAINTEQPKYNINGRRRLLLKPHARNRTTVQSPKRPSKPLLSPTPSSALIRRPTGRVPV